VLYYYRFRQQDIDGHEAFSNTAVARLPVSGESATDRLNLHVYPNPTSGDATFEFLLEDATTVHLQLVDLNGRVVYSRTTSELPAGLNTLHWHRPSGLAAGVYAWQLKAGTTQATGKLVVQ
jgi:hypothetical protein